jgi:DNA-binding beta-propeller fold protein YncE
MKKALLSMLLLMGVACTLWAAEGAGYHQLNRFRLGGEGGWDYLTFDSAGHRLFIARSTRVMVVDADSGKQTTELLNTPGVHGVALAGDLGRAFTSDGGDSMVTILDLKNLRVLDKVAVGNTPDAILFDPASRRVFTFNARGHDTTALDAAGGKVVGSIPLGGKPEFAAADGKGHIYVNIEDKNEVIEFDAGKLSILNHWPLAPCEEPTGMAIDQQHRRLFVGCHNNLMAVVNADSGKVIATLPIGAGVDGTAFDPETQLAFSSNGGSGTLTVVHEDSPDRYTVVENVDTASGARTLALDPKTHRIYLVTAEFEAATDATGRRRRMVPDTFQLLVFGPK